MKKRATTEKTIQPETTLESIIAGSTNFSPRRSYEEITNTWLAEKRKAAKGKGDNDDTHLADIAVALKHICHNKQNETFDFNDVISLTRGFDTPQHMLMPLWMDWVQTMKANKRISIINLIGIPNYTLC